MQSPHKKIILIIHYKILLILKTSSIMTTPKLPKYLKYWREMGKCVSEINTVSKFEDVREKILKVNTIDVLNFL